MSESVRIQSPIEAYNILGGEDEQQFSSVEDNVTHTDENIQIEEIITQTQVSAFTLRLTILFPEKNSNLLRKEKFILEFMEPKLVKNSVNLSSTCFITFNQMLGFIDYGNEDSVSAKIEINQIGTSSGLVEAISINFNTIPKKPTISPPIHKPFTLKKNRKRAIR